MRQVTGVAAVLVAAALATTGCSGSNDGPSVAECKLESARDYSQVRDAIKNGATPQQRQMPKSCEGLPAEDYNRIQKEVAEEYERREAERVVRNIR